MKLLPLVLALAAAFNAVAADAAHPVAAPHARKSPNSPSAPHRVIVFVWDGLRPDSINATDTPHLYALQRSTGTFFSDNHSTYPTFTMMNASSFATGGFPSTTGFYGNTLYQPNAGCNPAVDASGLPKAACATSTYGNTAAPGLNNFIAPVFTEDHAILDDLNAYYGSNGAALLNVGTLFRAAQAAGLKTAAIGKTGPAAMQDYLKGGDLLDESIAYPQSLAAELQAAGFALPAKTPLSPRYFTYTAPGAGTSVVTLAANNGDPTAAGAVQSLADGVTKDPRSTIGSPHNAANAYMMGVYANYILPVHRPDLTLIWFRTPDSTEHTYGPGAPNVHDGLKAMDTLLGQLQDQVAALGLAGETDLIIANDHGHTLVGGDTAYFPLRPITGAVGSGVVDTASTDPVNGFPVSGDVRTADLLSRQGVAHVYDGNGCSYDPVHSGIKADGSSVYPTQVEDAAASHGCAPGAKFSTRSYAVPAALPADATIIAANGGSDYLYLPDGDAARAASIVRVLQSRKEYGAIFANSRLCVDAACSNLPGVLPLGLVKLESTSTSTPDIVVSFASEANAKTGTNIGVPGTEYESMQNNWGMHGSFGVRDVHNTLIASGPDFKAGFVDRLPSGNVDVAPTVAYLLGLQMPQASGRVLHEALRGDRTPAPSVVTHTITSKPARGLVVQDPTDPDGHDVDATKTTYRAKLVVKTLKEAGGRAYDYFDHAAGERK